MLPREEQQIVLSFGWKCAFFQKNREKLFEGWKAEHLESICVYREDERRQAADRKRTRCARRRLNQKSTSMRKLVLIYGYAATYG